MSKKTPFNVSIMTVNEPLIEHLQPVEVMDLYEGASHNLHPKGLFSSELFGRRGDPIRQQLFSYIDIRQQIIHPLMYETLVSLKAMYEGIIQGTVYATWDAKLGDFVKSNELEGDTGYAFFFKHFKDLKPVMNNSRLRRTNITLFEKYKDKATHHHVLVLPAGLRDIEESEDGRVKKDEVNDYYTKLLSISNLVSGNGNDASQDVSRRLLQNTHNAIFDYFRNILKGKKGFIQDKFASRRIFNGTRNTIIAKKTARSHLHAPNFPDAMSTGLGLYQTAKGILPITKYHLLKFITARIPPAGDSAILVDPKTLQEVFVNLSLDLLDAWTTGEGMEKFINKYFETTLRHKPVKIGEHYLALVYKDDQHFKIFQDIRQLPEGFDKTRVAPITYAELLYLCNYQGWNRYRVWVTRYPVTSMGSDYPSKVYVYTTVKGQVLVELDDDWQPQPEKVALEFPITGMAFMDATIPDSTHLSGDDLGADFDGDQVSVDYVYTEEALEEVDAILHGWEHYLSPYGGMRFSTQTATINLVLHNMTGEPL